MVFVIRLGLRLTETQSMSLCPDHATKLITTIMDLLQPTDRGNNGDKRQSVTFQERQARRRLSKKAAKANRM